MTTHKRKSLAEIRHRLHEVLEEGGIENAAGRAVNRFIVFVIAVNLTAMVCESVPEYEEKFRALFVGIELASTFIFSLEYGLRIWVAAEHSRFGHISRSRARFKFMTSPLGIIDLLAVAPFWLAYVVQTDLRILLIFRAARFLKLVRYSPAMRSLLDAVYAERRALFGCLVILLVATLISASVMHIVEGNAQPDKFGTIPDAMWWAIVTLGTIGYGDVVPITALGKWIAAVTIFTGLIMVAMPVGVIASAFAREVHRRDFIITWGMVARVPLFAELNASEIADVSQLLRAQKVEMGHVIARRGEIAHSMYFIAAGEVEIVLKDKRITMGSGHFFGEMAALRRARRSATVTATMSTSLLVLDAQDLHALMHRQPHIARRIHEVMQDRTHIDIISSKGDLVKEELSDHEIDDQERELPPEYESRS